MGVQKISGLLTNEMSSMAFKSSLNSRGLPCVEKTSLMIKLSKSALINSFQEKIKLFLHTTVTSAIQLICNTSCFHQNIHVTAQVTQVMRVQLSCYWVLLSFDSKTWQQDSCTFVTWTMYVLSLSFRCCMQYHVILDCKVMHVPECSRQTTITRSSPGTCIILNL